MSEALGAERDSYEVTILQNVRPEREFQSVFCHVATVHSHIIIHF
jgi:hypothetical protein